MWNELIDTLCFWAKLGVDGFRCDVATLVPLEFWKEARKALLEVNSNFILLAESVEPGFIKYIRECGFEAASDCELYEAFDILYDYDIYSYYLDYLKNRKNLNVWLNELNRQQTTYPKNYIKSHCLENHDQVRSAAFVKDEVRLRNLDALIYFIRGTTFIYNGQEALDEVQQSLFDIDLVNWDNLGKYDISSLMRRCSEIKKDPLFKESNYDIILEEIEVAHLKYENDEEVMEIILNVGNVEGSVKVSLPDGIYLNLFDNKGIEVKNSLVEVNKNPLVIKCNK